VKEVKNKVGNPCNKEKQKCHSLLADSDDEDDHDKDKDIVDDCVQQLRRYKQSEESVPKSIDPLVWWKANEYKFPVIAKLAKKYLSIVATSVPSERLFSQAGQVVSQKRARLMPSRVNDLLFLNSFLRTGEPIKVSTYFLVHTN